MALGTVTRTDGTTEYMLVDGAGDRERWFGKSADQSGDDWAADVLTLYRAISGNGVYGADASDEALVLGAEDTPDQSGMTHFRVSRLLVMAASAATVYKLRLVWGTGTMAAAITAGQYTELMAALVTAAGPYVPVEVKAPILAAGTRAWLQIKCVTNNATLDFLVGIREY